MTVPDAQSMMPPPAPLAMPVQDLRAAPAVARTSGFPIWQRTAVFTPALIVTGLMLWGLHGLFAQSGMSWLENLLLVLIGLTFVWVTLAVSTVGVGLWSRRRSDWQVKQTGPLDVALLVPVHNENPEDVCGNAAAMLDDLARCTGPHRYTLYLLSDTTDPVISRQERRAAAVLRTRAPFRVFYRKRAQNTDRKVGNLSDWITGWGAAHDAMVVLDADSLMTGGAINRLADEMAADPKAGLIQTFPQLIVADTLFARLQQFSNVAYGWLLAEGLAAWSRSEGNYWGHNAIIRIRAFAETAGLPHLKRGQLILSHDFFEASLLRRAGWSVRFLPRIGGSYEETPQTLVDHVLRDQRWCRGNLQHLRLIATRGLHPVSRFHLFQGAAAYLMSPAWFVLLIFWALLGRDADTNVISYFNEANPMFPNWPPEMTHLDSLTFLGIMYAMLLAPKLAAALAILARRGAVRLYGGSLAFLHAFTTEIVLSIAYAPIMMIQQTKAVIRSLATDRGAAWAAQSRGARQHGWAKLLVFHAIETVLGIALLVGILVGLVSAWLLPIVASLAMAVPLSRLSACNLSRCGRGWRMDSPLTLREPGIVGRAMSARDEIRGHLMAAE